VAHATAVRLRPAPLRRELELLAQRGRVQLHAPTEPRVVKAKAPSAVASLGLIPREAEMLALVAVRRTNRQIGRELFITERLPVSMSRGSWPSSGSPAVARRPRSPTDSASTSDDPRRPWRRLFLGVVGDLKLAAPTSASRGSGYSLLALAASMSAREVMRSTTAVHWPRPAEWWK
jgi:hypothetical protein